MRGLVWFREDLRIEDNTALCQAVKHCDEGVMAVYVIDIKMWETHDMAPSREKFIREALISLEKELQAHRISFVVLELTGIKNLLQTFHQLIKKEKVQALFFNQQYEIDEMHRDEKVRSFFKKQGKEVFAYHDQTILPPGSVLTKEGAYFKVFTAYKHAWKKRFLENGQLKLNNLRPVVKIKTTSEVSSKEAVGRLNYFIKNNLFSYHDTRDFPALETTSHLSPYLAAGLISARQCFLAALKANQFELDTGNEGALTWMNELIWRDFYKHILVAVPRVSMHLPYKLQSEKIKWKKNKTHLKAWQEGKTGIPIVDAGMRQLNQTGWMHNRLRMITAMFFTKNLFLDWRVGEKYFMSHLIDGDLSANNGGWQWCASTGTDAAPYFRIFNPISQSERFDPEGEFIRQYCPELKELDNHAIHDPHQRAPLLMEKIDYPKPIVDLKITRQFAIDIFRHL